MSAGLNKAGFADFVECVKRLEQMAEPSRNDIRYGQYVQYVNCAVSKFVDEKAYLVGSTAERTKLSFSKDDGDADVLIVSGKLQVPVENLEFKVHNRCYVWLKAGDHCKNLGLEIIDGRYLSASSLRELRPELFTMLRAIHSQMTASFDRLPYAGRKDTQVTVPSKVGLASTKYEGLKLYGNQAQHDRQYRPKEFLHRSEKTKDVLIKRWKTVQVRENDTKMLRRALKVLKIAKHPGGRGQSNGQLSFVVQAIDDAISRPKPTFSQNIPSLHCKRETYANESYEEIDKNVTYENDLNEDNHEKNRIETMRVTYKSKHHRDFVPALKIIGDIEYLMEWKRRVEATGWTDSRINDIYSTDIFVVSRLAPVNPNIDEDFCLSFNLSEQKLVKSMTNVQRRVFLLLKCFLKGIFEEKHMKEGIEMKMKTYHVKTFLFWLYESYNHSAEVDDFETVYVLLQTALGFLRSKLIEKEL
ncbi:uncharacterized protein LOC123537073 [Mercenaria mercenaria]|uniref:uncharacterized protein LOC123537073 n=1 Tax=Mercenaria mercenaria TaxID=6596 RepID=UPI00234E516A|nr:uncharacterized protein LOC123537073 [Mercenaria mercenaria]